MVEGKYPAVAFNSRGFKVKFTGSELQDELVISTGDDFSNIGLC